jgi:pyruvate/2-oxoglutarate dehydrogenase complex dihydrolipoamide acyltransferase (E2) component
VTPAAPPIPTPGGTVAEPPASAPAAPATGTEPHEHDEASAGTGSALAWLPALLLGAAALVFAILIAIDASSGSGSGSSAAGNRLREQVLAAAKQCAAQANTYDYRSLDASEAKAAACTTGVYHTENQSTFEKVIKKYAPKLHATQSAQIDTAGIENISEDGKTWTVLLFGQLVQTNNTTAKQGRYDPQAIEVVMTNVGGKWLVSALNGA